MCHCCGARSHYRCKATLDQHLVQKQLEGRGQSQSLLNQLKPRETRSTSALDVNIHEPLGLKTEAVNSLKSVGGCVDGGRWGLGAVFSRDPDYTVPEGVAACLWGHSCHWSVCVRHGRCSAVGVS